MKKILQLIAIALCLGIACKFINILPNIGDEKSMPNSHVSNYYIENAKKDTHAPNLVTAIIVDYRAFDTMYETTVMFLAGLGVFLILSNRPKSDKRYMGNKNYIRIKNAFGIPVYKTQNKDVIIAFIIPIIMIYALYVLFHGEISLGGGFQAGALFGMVYILDKLAISDRGSILNIKKEEAVILAAAGTFIYVLTGILCMIGGKRFLDFTGLNFIRHSAERHPVGIILVEIGVVICVMATIIAILGGFLEKMRFDDDRN